MLFSESSLSAAQPRSEPSFGNILVTSAAQKIPLIQSVMDAAQDICPTVRVYAGDSHNQVLARYFTPYFWHMPILSDDCVSDLIEYCSENQIRLIIPTRDGELLFWARHQMTFASCGIHVLVSPTNALERCLDKLYFSQWCAQHAIPAIASTLDIASLDSDYFVVKERWGAGSKHIGLRLSLAQAKAHATQLQHPIFQPFIAGIEISADGYADAFGRVKGLVLRHRDYVVRGESQVTTTFRHTQFEPQLIACAEHMHLRGPFVIQAIIDANGALHLIECNSRFGGASTLSIHVGLKFWHWAILEAHGCDLAQYPYHRAVGEARQIRIPKDMVQYGSDF
jgi:carbamoyl-phosphate synthase large subunit